MKVIMPWIRQITVTTSAVLTEGLSGSMAGSGLGGVARGKKMRNNSKLQRGLMIELRPFEKVDKHDCEARPLHPHLGNAEQSSEAGKSTDFLTTCDICSTSGEDQYVRELACP